MWRKAPSVSGPGKDFNLLRGFALLSFLCVSVLTASLWFIVSHYLTREMLVREWETTGNFIRTETKQWVPSENFRSQDLGEVAEKFRNLHNQITLMPDIVRIKVYNSQGVILWSDEDRLVGTAFADNPELREALEGKIIADVSSMDKGENVYERGAFQRLVEVYVPIFADDGRKVVGVIEAYKSADALYRDIQRARVVVLIVTGGGGLLLYLSLFAIVRQAASKIDEQQKNLLQMQTELIASQRMAAVGEMAAAVAHGIGNPLSSIRAAAQVAKLDCTEQNGCAQGEKTQRHLESIIEQVDRVQKRMRGLLNFVRPLEPHPVPVEIASLLREAVDGLRPRFEEAAVTCRLDLVEPLPKARMDPTHLEQIVVGLAVNAIDATPPAGTVTIGARLCSFHGNSQAILVSIEDTGEGIPAENRQRVFEPFFTTKPHGTGIGLPLAKKFAERNGGEIAVKEGAAGGTRIEVTIPLTNGT